MASSSETLIFELIGKDPSASRAFSNFRRTVDDTSRSVDKNSTALDKNAKSADKNAQANKSALGALVGVGLAFAPITAGAAAAGVGVAAFGALAVPSVKKVATALTGPGGLAASWVTLDNRQRNAALSIQALGHSYSALARTLEPQVFQVFNQGLGLANSLLGPVGRLAHTAGQGFSDFLANFASNSGIQQFIGFLSTQARPALALLGSDITHISHALFQLLQSFAGTGLLELRALTGVFTALDDAISFLSQHAPGLTAAGVAIGGIALALSKLGLLSGALKITGISAIAGQLAGFTTATRGATLAEKGLLATSTALEAITPFGWAVLGAAALGGLVFWASKFRTVTDTSIASIEAQSKAQGFNTAGYFAASRAIQQVNDQQAKQKTTLVNLHTGLTQGTVAVGSLTGATKAYSDAQQKLVTEGKNQDTFLGILQQKYGLTRDAAIGLAQHSGVLATQVNKGGSAMHNALTQAEAYADSNLKAQRPVSRLAQDIADYSDKTLTATDRTKALSDALSQFFNPAVSADQAVITLRNDQRSLAKALDASGGKTGLLTQKQRDARGAFDTYINDVASAAQAAFTATGRTSSYTRIINNALPFLERAAGHNRTLRQEIQRLIDTESRMRSENVAIHVSGTGSWAVVPGGHRVGQPGAPFAAGGRITAGTTPTADNVLIRASKDETVVSAAHSRLPFMQAAFQAAGVPGYAAGGVVGSYASHSLPGLDKWLKSENQATIHAIAASTAKATAAALRSTFGGGTGKEVARYALGYNGGTAFPYVLGGASPHGWDCSGFTAWVYEKFGLMPGHQGSRFGTSETQAAWVKRTPRPEVGGLAFFNDGVFANPGHVGVITSPTTYISAHSPQTGTTNSPISGAVMFGIPPGRTIAGFESGLPQGGGGPLPGGGSVAANIAVGRQEASQFGWGTGPSWHDLFLLWNKESGWRNTAQNPTSTAYGIAQFLDSTWATVGGRKTSNPGRQILLGLRYIQRRYGSPENAWAHELAFNSYDRGGYLPTGWSAAYNGTGRPEPVIPAGRAGGGRSYTINVSVPAAVNKRQVGREIVEAIREFEMSSGKGWRS